MKNNAAFTKPSDAVIQVLKFGSHLQCPKTYSFFVFKKEWVQKIRSIHKPRE